MLLNVVKEVGAMLNIWRSNRDELHFYFQGTAWVNKHLVLWFHMFLHFCILMSALPLSLPCLFSLLHCKIILHLSNDLKITLRSSAPLYAFQPSLWLKVHLTDSWYVIGESTGNPILNAVWLKHLTSNDMGEGSLQGWKEMWKVIQTYI